VSILERREQYSLEKIESLKSKLQSIKEATDFENLTIVGAGSFARLEGSEHSDIDLFFFCNSKKDDIKSPRTKELSLFGKLIEVIKEEGFPPLSGDARFLQIMYMADISSSLGSPLDDHQNFFTARMLLLLESKCLYNDKAYSEAVRKIISLYYRDYPTHKKNFFPTFLLNDITRYWKTILLNYENKRNIKDDQKIQHKIKNFKLKFSRLTTCFTMIAVIGSLKGNVTENDIYRLVNLTPVGRLNEIRSNIPELSNFIDEITNEYSEFIEMTGLSTKELERKFEEKEDRDILFEKAKIYGDSMYNLLQEIDKKNNSEISLIRMLVI